MERCWAIAFVHVSNDKAHENVINFFLSKVLFSFALYTKKNAKLFINNVWWHYQFFSSIPINSSPSQQHSNMFIWWNQIFVWWVILILAKKFEYQVSEQINNAARSGTLYENVHCWNSMINASTDWQVSKHWLAINTHIKLILSFLCSRW